jgi:hypothetical protein
MSSESLAVGYSLRSYFIIFIILLLFILTANGFLSGRSSTTIRHNTQITHIAHNNTMIKRNTAHKFTHTLHKMNKLSLEYNNHNYHYVK